MGPFDLTFTAQTRRVHPEKRILALAICYQIAKHGSLTPYVYRCPFQIQIWPCRRLRLSSSAAASVNISPIALPSIIAGRVIYPGPLSPI